MFPSHRCQQLPRLCRWFAVVCLALFLAPSVLEAQYPRARRGQFEVSGFDFGRNGAWRRRVSTIRADRHQLLRARAFGALNMSSPTAAGTGRVTGRVIVPVVPITFHDVTPPFPVTLYENLFFSPTPTDRPYSLKSFYEQLSNGNITIDGRVSDWITADSTEAYYADGCNGIGVLAPCPVRPVNRFGELLLEILGDISQRADAATFWSDFDNDGPDGRPNSGDDDGVVDFVTFLQPEQDGACPGSVSVWAHRFVMRAWNGGSPYVTRTPWVGHPGQFLKVDDYIIQSAVGGSSACDPTTLMPIGTVAHETGHAFGLPDLYDTDLNSPNATEGIGEWGLMGSGNYARPYSPARFEAWSLFELGWVTVDTLSAGRDVRLGPVTSSDTILYLPIPNTDEYYLLENRQALESDSAQMNPAFGSRHKDPGLLIWHIDQGQVDQHGFNGDNRVNSGPTHGVALVQADGRNDLGQPGGGNRGDAGDAFPGSTGNSAFCRSTTPAARDNQGTFARSCVDSIAQLVPGGAMTLRYISYRSVYASDHAGALIQVNGALISRLEQFFSPGASVQLSADSIQTDGSGRTRFEFLAWSDGGTRSHTRTAGETPDTIVAQMVAEHRLRTGVEGAAAAAVTTGVTGDITSGVFINEGSTVSLQAEAQPGAVFVGWSGDTTSRDGSLTLVMRHPFDLTANFVAVHEAPLPDAANDLFGVSSLDPDQSIYMDAVGNKNGIYDLGDFLAASVRASSPAAGKVSAGTNRAALR
jgi:M6 family metalloprotease-like protein